MRIGIVGIRFLDTAEVLAALGDDALDLTQEVVDRLVARRGDADALARVQELGDNVRAGERLARPRRSLDD